MARTERTNLNEIVTKKRDVVYYNDLDTILQCEAIITCQKSSFRKYWDVEWKNNINRGRTNLNKTRIINGEATKDDVVPDLQSGILSVGCSSSSSSSCCCCCFSSLYQHDWGSSPPSSQSGIWSQYVTQCTVIVSHVK